MSFIIWGDILGVINDAKFKNDICNTISFGSSFSGFTLHLTKFCIFKNLYLHFENFHRKIGVVNGPIQITQPAFFPSLFAATATGPLGGRPVCYAAVPCGLAYPSHGRR